MSPRLYLLDTDTCIFLMRGATPVLQSRLQSVPLAQQAMSAVTLAELAYGVRASAASMRRHNQSVLDHLVLHLTVLDWPASASEHYAALRWDLRKRGAQLGAADLMIAAHALSLGAVVVSRNTKDFRRVKGLAVEDWTVAG